MALRKGHLNSWSPNLTVLVISPQDRIADLLKPCRCGHYDGTEELWGIIEYAMPVSSRNLSLTCRLLSLLLTGLCVSLPVAGGAVHAGVGFAAIPQVDVTHLSKEPGLVWLGCSCCCLWPPLYLLEDFCLWLPLLRPEPPLHKALVSHCSFKSEWSRWASSMCRSDGRGPRKRHWNSVLV